MTWNELKTKLLAMKGELSWTELQEKIGVNVRNFMQGTQDTVSQTILEELIKQGIITQEESAQLKEPPKIEYVPLPAIKPHPMNAEIYGDGADQELLDSIREKGILTPIIVTEDGTIISGHRRFNAAQMLGLKEVPVIRIKPIDALEAEELLILTNKQRNKTNEQIAREYKKLKSIEAEKARRRMLSGKSYPSVNSREGHGKASEKAAEVLGVGEQKAERAAKVVEHVDNLKKQGKVEEAKELQETLNGKSVNAAYQKVAAQKQSEPKPMQQSFVTEPEPVYPEQEQDSKPEPEPLEEKLARLEKKLEKEMVENARLYSENLKLRAHNFELREENSRLKEQIFQISKSSIHKSNEEPIYGMLYSVTCNGMELQEWNVNPNKNGNQYEFTHRPTQKKFLFACTPVAIVHLQRLFQVNEEMGLLLLQEEQEIEEETNVRKDVGYGS